MPFTHHSLVRGAADEVLHTVFNAQYGVLTMDQATLLIDDLIDLANEEGLDSLYDAAQLLRQRLRPVPLASYVATLEAKAQATAPPVAEPPASQLRPGDVLLDGHVVAFTSLTAANGIKRLAFTDGSDRWLNHQVKVPLRARGPEPSR